MTGSSDGKMPVTTTPPTWASLCQLGEGADIPLPQLGYSCRDTEIAELQKYLNFPVKLDFSVNLTFFFQSKRQGYVIEEQNNRGY